MVSLFSEMNDVSLVASSGRSLRSFLVLVTALGSVLSCFICIPLSSQVLLSSLLPWCEVLLSVDLSFCSNGPLLSESEGSLVLLTCV